MPMAMATFTTPTPTPTPTPDMAITSSSTTTTTTPLTMAISTSTSTPAMAISTPTTPPSMAISTPTTPAMAISAFASTPAMAISAFASTSAPAMATTSTTAIAPPPLLTAATPYTTFRPLINTPISTAPAIIPTTPNNIPTYLPIITPLPPPAITTTTPPPPPTPAITTAPTTIVTSSATAITVTPPAASTTASSHGFLPPCDRDPKFTRDGSLNYKSRPAIRALTGGSKACRFIHWYTIIDRISFYAISSNLVTYLTTELCEGTAESAMNVNNYCGVGTMVSILGAFVADSYLGQYRSIAFVSAIYLLGWISLTLFQVLKPFKHVQCDGNNSITTIQATTTFISLYLISIGTGVVRNCLGAFGGEQFDDTNDIERRKKSSYFNWWSFSTSCGSLLAFTIVLYIQDNVGWGTSFEIVTGGLLITVILFFAGTPLFRSKPPIGSPFTNIAQVVVAAIRNWNVQVPNNSMLLYEKCDKDFSEGGRMKLLHTNELRFLDKAATEVNHNTQFQLIHDKELHTISSITDANMKERDNVRERFLSPWKLCSVTQVEEVKLIVRIIPIWITSLVFCISIVQVLTFFTKQGVSMDRHITSNFIIPAASLLSVSMVVTIAILPIYDTLFVPATRWITGNERGITMLQRLGTGMFFSIIMMAVAALTESKRLHIAKQNGLIDNPHATIPMSIFWLLPQYVLYGVIYVFAVSGLQEFFYDQVPNSMKGMGIAFLSCAFGLSSFLCNFLITIVDSITRKYRGKSWFVNNFNKCHLDYFYWLVAILSTLNFIVYLLLARRYAYKKVS